MPPPPCEISDLLYHKIAKNVKRGGITCKNRLFSNFAIPQNAQKCQNRGYNLQKMTFFGDLLYHKPKKFFAIPQWGGMGGGPLTCMEEGHLEACTNGNSGDECRTKTCAVDSKFLYRVMTAFFMYITFSRLFLNFFSFLRFFCEI